MRAEVENAKVELLIHVSEEMTARLDRHEIHRLYSTFWLGRHVELAARRAIEPYFEEGEDALGTALEIQHLAMAPVGAQVRITAWVTQVKGRLIRCNFEAFDGDVMIARGIQDQVFMPAADIQAKIAAAYARLGEQ